MKNVSSFFPLEFSRFCSKKGIVVLIVLFVIILYQVQVGIDGYKVQDEKIERFKDIYQSYFKTIGNYNIYALFGIQVLFVKSKLDFLYPYASVPNDLISKFDTISSLRILNDFKGKSLAPDKISIDMGFSGIFLFIINMLAMLYGANIFDSREYYKFLSSKLSPEKVFLSILLSRLCIIALSMVVLFSAVIIMIKINGIALAGGDYMGICGYMTAAFLMVAFFFILGVITGTFSKGILSLIHILALLFIFLFLAPGIINTITVKRLPSSSDALQAEQDKFNILSEFEKRKKKENEGFDRNKIEDAKKVIEGYWNKENKEMEGVEQRLRDRIDSYVDYYRSLAQLTPVTFYQLTGNEVSSRGFDSYLDFYSYTQSLKHKFARFYIDRCFYNDPKELVSFIKDNENLYYSRTRLPVNFLTGVVINLGIIVILSIAALYRFKQYIYAILSQKTLRQNNHAIILSKGDHKVLHIDKEKGLIEKLYNLLSGRLRTGETVKLEIDNVDLTDNRTAVDFLYICHPGQIPGDIKVGAFFNFIFRLLKLSKKEKIAVNSFFNTETDPHKIKHKTFGELSSDEKGKVVSVLLPYFRQKIYLVDSVEVDMPVQFLIDLNDIILKWAGSGSSVLYLTTESEIKVERFKMEKSGCDFSEMKVWSEMVSTLKELSDS